MRKRYSATFKAQVVLEVLKEEKTISQIASEHGVHPNQIYKWKAQALESLPQLFADEQQTTRAMAAHERELQDLYAQIGQLTTQLAWLKKKSGLDSVER